MSVLHAPTYRWTVAEYEELGRSDVFAEDQRVELLDGEIVVMSPIGYRHVTAVNRLVKFFAQRAGGRYDVSIQNPFTLDASSQPQPDIALLNVACDRLPRLASPAEIFLVIEVADSTARYDREDKGPLYATSGIPEYWLLNLEKNCLEVFREPQDGHYGHASVHPPANHISPLAFPDLNLQVGDFLP